MQKPFIASALIELYECKAEKLVDRGLMRRYLRDACAAIDMKRIGKRVVIYNPGSRGISAVQVIKTSHIVVHTYPARRFAFLDVVSCKDFDAVKAAEFSKNYLGASRYQITR